MIEAAAPHPRSKAVAAWLALVGGSLGLHRFYLHGPRDVAGWLHPWPTLAGAYGFWRMRELGVDDRLGALLVPLLGLMLAATMLAAIVIGLTSDARWQARYGTSGAADAAAGVSALPVAAPGSPPNAWASVAAVILALAVGAGITMATIAFTAQRYFETRSESSAAGSGYENSARLTA